MNGNIIFHFCDMENKNHIVSVDCAKRIYTDSYIGRMLGQSDSPVLTTKECMDDVLIACKTANFIQLFLSKLQSLQTPKKIFIQKS